MRGILQDGRITCPPSSPRHNTASPPGPPMSVAANPPSEKPPAAARGLRPGNADFEAIYEAVMATDRGRWFLSEYARRNRHTDTAIVLAAIDRLVAETRVDARAAAAKPTGPDPERLCGELA